MIGVLRAAIVLAATATAASAQPAPSIRIAMERTACFGTCPVYSVEMRDDGRVEYSGQQHVRVAGTHTWTIDPALVRTLARDMEKAGFFEMKDKYTAPVTDLPTTRVALAIDGRSKTITDYFGAPPAVKELEARIDAVSGARGYVRIDAAAIRRMLAEGWRPGGDETARWMDQALVDGDAGTVTALLDAGVNARAADADGETLVMKAAMSGDADTVRAVLAAGGDPTARDRAGRNAADRVRDIASAAKRTAAPIVEATGRPRDYAAILRLLTDE